MRQVAVLLAEDPPKEEKARIRAEALIRDDNLIEALEIIQLECEMLHERMKLLEYSKECPSDLVSVISTVVWAAHRVDVPELMLVRQQFKARYGKKFEENAMHNIGGCLNERVVTKLSVQPPAAYLVQVYLEKICEQFDVDWKPLMKITPNDMIVPMQAPTGISVPMGTGTGLGPKLVGYNDPMAAHTGMSQSDLSRGGDLSNNMPPIPTVTGVIYQNNNNNNSFGNGNGGGGGIGSPMSTITTATTDFPIAPRNGGNGTSNTQQFQPNRMQPPIPPPSSSQLPPGDFDEPDIFIPGGSGPSAPPGSVAPSTYPPPQQQQSSAMSNINNFSTSDNNNHNNNNNNGLPPSSASNNVASSYEDLTARFNQLKK
jgi:Regulator of Vps4 activity in the MVB pathway